MFFQKNETDEHGITLPPIYSTRGDGQSEASEESGHLLLTCFRRSKIFIVRNFHSVTLTSACVVAVVIGLLMRSWRAEPYPPVVILAIKLLGILYERFLEGMQLPLIVTGVVTTIGTVSRKTSYRILLRLYACQVIFTSLAIIISIMLMVCFGPARGATDIPQMTPNVVPHINLVHVVLDVIRNLCPPNIFESLIYHYEIAYYKPLRNNTGLTGFEKTVRHYNNPIEIQKDADEVAIFGTSRPLPNDWNPGYALYFGKNFMGIVFAVLVISLCVSEMRRRARAIINLCEDINLLMFEMIKVVNLFSPLGVFSLLLGEMLALNLDKIQSLVFYCIISLVALFIHSFITLPFIVMIMANFNPIHFIFNQTHSSLAAFCTESELTAYAVNLDCVVNKNQVDVRVANIALALGHFYNKNGTVIIQCTGTLYVAKVMKVSLTIGQLAMIGLVSVISSIGSEEMIYSEINVLAIDLYPLTFSIISSANKLLSPFASACDAFSSAIAAAIVANLSQQDLSEEDKKRIM